MCERCPIGGKYPFRVWPHTVYGYGDFGPPPIIPPQNLGPEPSITWFIFQENEDKKGKENA